MRSCNSGQHDYPTTWKISW